MIFKNVNLHNIPIRLGKVKRNREKREPETASFPRVIGGPFVFYSKKGFRIFSFVLLYILIRTFGYFDNASKAWFGEYSFNIEEGTVPKEVDFILTIIFWLMLLLFIMEIFYLFEIKKKSSRGLLAGTMVSLFLMTVVMILFGSFYIRNEKYIRYLSI